MATQKTGDESPKEETKAEKSPSIKHLSTDIDNGVVVYETSAEDGAPFTCVINEQKIKAHAKGGQVWFYAKTSLGESPSIRLD